jgi:hypothetical protein
MERHHFCVAASLLGLLFATGCAGSPEDEDPFIGDDPSPQLHGNALNGNALNGNALNGNALNGNALNGNGLSLAPSMLSATPLDFGALSAATRALLLDPGATGALSRELLKYTVSCALAPSQALHYTWVDAAGVTHDESPAGLLGLASDWASSPLDTPGQQWVSACLTSRVNRFQIPVLLSSRGSAAGLAATAAELSAYTYAEGAFWGNVFSDPPTAYACDVPANDAHSQSLYRTCSFPFTNDQGNLVTCGIVQPVGSCATVCNAFSPEGFYRGCSAGAGQASYARVVTIFLP